MLVCPGDHFSLSELPNAEVTGSILATAIAFTYRSMFPEIARPTRTFNQRRAVEKLCCGVRVFLHSKNGNILYEDARLVVLFMHIYMNYYPLAHYNQCKFSDLPSNISYFS